MEELRREDIKTDFGSIPIVLYKHLGEEVLYSIEIDGVEWVLTSNKVHAVVLFTMMQEHITEYVHYEKK